MRNTAGWPPLALVLVLIAVGDLFIALADSTSRRGGSGGQVLFWTGIVLVALPSGIYVASRGPARDQRFAVVVTAGLGFYITKVLYIPGGFFESDEYVHFRTARDILSSHALFSFNPLLPEASHYPGLPAVAAIFSRASGLSLPTAALVVVGVSRFVLIGALFALLCRALRSDRAAAVATLIYAANPNFIYWSSQFSYESLALPLLAFILLLLIMRFTQPTRWSDEVILSLAILASVITHHLTSYLLCVILVVASAVAWRRRAEYVPAVAATVAVVATVLWVTLAAPVTVPYLGAIARNSLQHTIDLLAGSSAPRKLFTTATAAAPVWERVVGITSTLVLVAALLWSLPRLWKSRGRLSAAMVGLILAGCVFPLTLPFRLVASAQETANRSTEFLYVGVGATIVLALCIASSHRGARRATGAISIVGGLMLTFLIIGGVTTGTQYSERLPPSAEAHAFPDQLVNSEIAADRWASSHLPRGTRIAGDAVGRLGLATYGRQRTIWPPADGVTDWQVMLPPAVTPEVVRLIRKGQIGYVFIERRLSWGLPSIGYIFNRGEPEDGTRRRPLRPSVLEKFAGGHGVDVIYDNGYESISKVAGIW